MPRQLSQHSGPALGLVHKRCVVHNPTLCGTYSDVVAAVSQPDPGATYMLLPPVCQLLGMCCEVCLRSAL